MLRKKDWGWKLLLGIVALLWVIPLVYMISVSFRKSELALEPVLFVSPAVLTNFTTVFQKSPLGNNFLSSIIITLSTVVLVAAFAAMVTFGLTRKEIVNRRLIYNVLMVTLMVPISALVIPLTQINSRLHWLNQYQALIFPYTALGIPFAMVILKGFMDAFPKELEEAATIDGCGYGRMFFHIVLPFLRPGLIVIVIWQFLTSWNEFFLALVTISEVNRKPLSLVPMQYQGFYFSQPGALFAVLVIITVPTVAFYIAVQRHFVSGMMSGALKE